MRAAPGRGCCFDRYNAHTCARIGSGRAHSLHVGLWCAIILHPRRSEAADNIGRSAGHIFFHAADVGKYYYANHVDEVDAHAETVKVATLVLQFLVDNGCFINIAYERDNSHDTHTVDISYEAASRVARLIDKGHIEVASLYCQLLELVDRWGARMRHAGQTFELCAAAVAFFAGNHHRTTATVEQLKRVPYMRRVGNDAKMKQLLERGKVLLYAIEHIVDTSPVGCVVFQPPLHNRSDSVYPV